MKLKPIHDNVILKPIDESITKSRIALPSSAEKEYPEQGEVIAIGPGKILKDGTRAPISVKIGDQILFKKFSPDEIEIDGEGYLIILDEDIKAILI